MRFWTHATGKLDVGSFALNAMTPSLGQATSCERNHRCASRLLRMEIAGTHSEMAFSLSKTGKQMNYGVLYYVRPSFASHFSIALSTCSSLRISVHRVSAFFLALGHLSLVQASAIHSFSRSTTVA